MTAQVIQQRLDLEKYLSPLVRSVDGVLQGNRFHAHKLDSAFQISDKTAIHLEDCVASTIGKRLIDICIRNNEKQATQA